MTLKNVTFLFLAGTVLYLAATFVLDHPAATPETMVQGIGNAIGDVVRAVGNFFLSA